MSVQNSSTMDRKMSMRTSSRSRVCTNHEGEMAVGGPAAHRRSRHGWQAGAALGRACPALLGPTCTCWRVLPNRMHPLLPQPPAAPAAWAGRLLLQPHANSWRVRRVCTCRESQDAHCG